MGDKKEDIVLLGLTQSQVILGLVGVAVLVTSAVAISAALAPTTFKKIKIYHDPTKTECLHFSEIEILDNSGQKVNISKDNIVMSSVYVAEGADKFNKDKIIDNDGNTIAHTQCGKGESITITFDKYTTISKITILNRYGGNQVRFNGVYIALFTEDTIEKCNTQTPKDATYQKYVYDVIDNKLVLNEKDSTKL